MTRMRKLIFVLLLLPLVTLAQAGGELTVGEQTITYDSQVKSEAGVLYFLGDDLVASEQGVVTLVYENDEVVLEAHDTDGDGQLDAFIALDGQGEVVEITGDRADAFVRPEVVEFTDLLKRSEEVGGGSGASTSSTDEDLVGDLDSITIPRYHNYVQWALFILLVGGGVWWYRKKKRGKE